MKRNDSVTSNTHEQHDVRNASAISGALIGATAGILGGLVGVGVAGLAGATVGALGGLALERRLRQTEEHVEDETDTASLIEPPCPDCVEVRASSGGAVFWCARHGGHHSTRHPLHYEYPQSFALGSMLLRPTF